MTRPFAEYEGADEGPHAGQPIVTAGAPLLAAEVAVVCIHGRGGTADGIVRLAEEFYRHGVAMFAPQAARSRWYPHSFLAPVERNEPHLSSALGQVGRTLTEVGDAGIPPERTVLFGVSQGACLAAEFAVRHPLRYGGVASCSGALISDPAGVGASEGGDPGPLAGTPAYFGAAEGDEHVPVERVRETAAAFDRLGASVTERITPGSDHGAADADLEHVGSLLDDLLAETE